MSEENNKIIAVGVVASGIEVKKIVTGLQKGYEVELLIAPPGAEQEFLKEFNNYRTKDKKLRKSVLDLKESNGSIEDYVFISKVEYESYLKFKRKSFKILSDEDIKNIKEEYENKTSSQRKLARKYKVSLTTIHKVIHDQY